ncbi:MAG: glutamate synthase, partial [Rhodospirillaceae bacterium]|nr:glutamate synthase [Rhodospirillaceae bacterium]
MMQNGRLVICGNAAKGLGDSMYQGQIWLGGEAVEMGSGVEQVDPEAGELDAILALLEKHKMKAPKAFKKLQSDKSLWNFNKHDFAAWKDAL